MAMKAFIFAAVSAALIATAASQNCAALGAALPGACSGLLPALQQNRDRLSGASDAQIQAFINTLPNKPVRGDGCCNAGVAFNQPKPFCGCDATVQATSKSTFDASPQDLLALSRAIALVCGGTAATTCAATG